MLLPPQNESDSRFQRKLKTPTSSEIFRPSCRASLLDTLGQSSYQKTLSVCIRMGKRLYVGNISWNTTEDDLRSAFGAGDRTVTDCHIVTDRETGRSRGFAFVELSSDEEAKAAVEELDGTKIDDRDIRVNEARERQERSGGGGGGGGGGDGGW